METVSGCPGQVTELNDQESVQKKLNLQTKRSTKVAVLVLRDEEKPLGERQTPLTVSIHEAKGEKRNIVL